jgi:phosphatidylinositol glycan class U
LVATSILAPVLWHLWIYNNSANANYYFAINLLYSSALIFIVTDLLLAEVRREFYLEHGYSVIEKLVNGKKMILQLK